MDLNQKLTDSKSLWPPMSSTDSGQNRTHTSSEQPEILTDIYRDDTNMAIWCRRLPDEMQSMLVAFMTVNPSFQVAMLVTPENAMASLQETLRDAECAEPLSEDTAELVAMFCCLFGLREAGLRLTVLNRAMCPRFHSDRVPCRLVTTYTGVATEWLPHHLVDRKKLGAGNRGLADDMSGLYQERKDIQQLSGGEVALLKGELWEGNEHAGLVHRSPQAAPDQLRLLLTLDFAA